MDSFKLKIIACIVMLMDHIGAALLPQYFFLRVIGRLAFPIFAFLIANGYTHTHDIKRYMQRLFIFALISQAPFYFTFKKFSPDISLNIFFTLFLGLCAIYIYDKYRSSKPLLLIMIISLAATLLNTDYGAYGVLIILSFYMFRESPSHLILSNLILNTAYMGYVYIYVLAKYSYIPVSYVELFVQAFSLLSLPLILKYNGKKGRSLKWAFYIFYPLHLTIIYVITKSF